MSGGDLTKFSEIPEGETSAAQEESELMPYMAYAAALESLPFADRISGAGWKEIARALRESSFSLEHAKRIIRYCVHESPGEDGNPKPIPTPFELRQVARIVPPRPGPKGKCPSPCPECEQHPGFRSVTKTLGRGVHKGTAYDCIEPCQCAAGRWQAAWKEAKNHG